MFSVLHWLSLGTSQLSSTSYEATVGWSTVAVLFVATADGALGEIRCAVVVILNNITCLLIQFMFSNFTRNFSISPADEEVDHDHEQ